MSCGGTTVKSSKGRRGWFKTCPVRAGYNHTKTERDIVSKSINRGQRGRCVPVIRMILQNAERLRGKEYFFFLLSIWGADSKTSETECRTNRSYLSSHANDLCCVSAHIPTKVQSIKRYDYVSINHLKSKRLKNSNRKYNANIHLEPEQSCRIDSRDL